MASRAVLADALSPLFTKTNKVFRKNFLTLVALSLSPVLVLSVVAAVMRMDVLKTLSIFLFNDPSVKFDVDGQMFVFMVLSLLGTAFIVSTTMVATIAMVNSEDKVSLRDAVAGGLSFYRQVVALGAVVALSVLGAYVIAPILGFVVAILMLFSLHALINDRRSSLGAVSVSRDIVLKNLFPTLVFMTAVVGVFYVLDWALGRFSLELSDRELVSLGLETLIVPYISVAFTALYLTLSQKNSQKGVN